MKHKQDLQFSVMNYGFVKVASAIPQVKVADCLANGKEIKSLIAEAEKEKVQVVIFPELCITGATCGDLFRQRTLLHNANETLDDIARYTLDMNLIVVVGLPIEYRSMLFNMAAIIHNGSIQGYVPKRDLTIQEHRWFTSAEKLRDDYHCVRKEEEDYNFIVISNECLFETPAFNFAIEFWNETSSIVPMSLQHIMAGADIILTPAATPESIGTHTFVKETLRSQSARYACGHVYASCGYGESTTDMVFSGNAMIYENGQLLKENERFLMKSQLLVTEIDVERLRNERIRNRVLANAPLDVQKGYYDHKEIDSHVNRISLTRPICPTPFVPQGAELDERCREVFDIQVAGLCKRIEHTHCQTAVVGISGGLDSTLALLVCAKAFDKLGRSRKEIVGITMPGFGTTGRTYNNALNLMQSLGVTIREISIKEACIQHFSDIGHDINTHDVTYENSQARERTQILMDVANQLNGMVIGTGDLSELALGWATYNGDHMSMYGVNAGVPKTLIQSLVGWIAAHHVDDTSASILRDIIDTPISPELIPADEQGNIKQKTEDLVGPYELHDFFIYHFIRNGFFPKKIFFLAKHAFEGKYEDEVIKKWLTTFCRRFFNQQFKRSCLPDGPKIGSVSLSPRGDWQMPSDACVTLWLRECEEL